MSDCPFCNPDTGRVFHQDPVIRCLWDGYPVSPGHALITPIRHFLEWFDATRVEQAALMEGLEIAKSEILKTHDPDGFNIGINIGAAAGQTVPHLHVHLIPRYQGDVSDPRGGIRHVIPGKGNYLAGDSRAPAATPGNVEEAPAIYTAYKPAIYGLHDRPLLEALLRDLRTARGFDMAVAFVLETGLARIQPHLEDLMDRGGSMRIVTGDYLGVTEPNALLRLLDLHASYPGAVQLRVLQAAPPLSFHPKAYIFHGAPQNSVVYVGSSNLTRQALEGGIEWNLRLEGRVDPAPLVAVRAEFDRLLDHPSCVPLTTEWVDDYRTRRPVRPKIDHIQPVDIDPDGEPPLPVVAPHAIQREALEALATARADGYRAGLVVLATGLGKTWLAAFDSQAFRRVLFVAHREEILQQARNTFRRIRPDVHLGFYTGGEKDRDADVLFASVMTLGRSAHLAKFLEDAFDYIVIDEFHHASAKTYRRLIDHFEPQFLLGLTATPDRSDGSDLLALCGEKLVFRCDLVRGIEEELLSAFHYFGVPDPVDYANIPWRSGRFDPEHLETAVVTQARAQNAFEQWQKRGGERTLAFCVSKRHADYMADFFLSRGVPCVAIHSNARAPRAESLEQLASGDLKIVFAVDMFNEGVDVPTIDTVLMLRPTESRILWLQQFGRGLRKAEGKARLNVVDYVGNHRCFLQGAMALLPHAGDTVGSIAYALEQLAKGELDLPPGCEVTYELEALNILRGLAAPGTGTQRAINWYRSFRDQHGTRPTAAEFWHAGFDPKSVRRQYGCWLGFVGAEGDLDEMGQQVLAANRPFLTSLEVTPMTKSYKMLVLLGMLARERLPGAIHIDDLIKAVLHQARRSPLLEEEFSAAAGDQATMKHLLETNPIQAWTEGRGTDGAVYFKYEDDVFFTEITIPTQHESALREQVREICEWRLAQYLERKQGAHAYAPRIVCKVSHTNGRPLLFLPDRSTHPGIPEGWFPIVAEETACEAKFAKIAINVLREVGAEDNLLPQVLRGWFGEEAGQPGRAETVVLQYRDSAYVMKPNQSAEAPDPVRSWVTYPRAEIPTLWGYEFSESRWNQGFVKVDNHVFLLVSLEKADLQPDQRYKDQFVSPDEFKWQSQNRQQRSSGVAAMLPRHREEGWHIHLFVRRHRKTGRGLGAPFYYCGEVDFVRWEGDKPITVWWALRDPVPVQLHDELLVPRTVKPS